MEEEFIYFFRTPNNYYFYDVCTNNVINTNEFIYQTLKKLKQKHELDTKELEVIKKLKKEGLLRNNPIKLLKHPESDNLENLLQRKLSNITLQITQQCNLRCKYCPYSGTYINRRHNDKVMDFETAQKAIDFLLMHSIDSKKINFSFYGGEPLLEIDLIKQCVDYIKANFKGKKITYSLTTNGTLLSDEITEFLINNDFVITISIDGPKEIHDSNRIFAINGEGSFDSVINSLKKIKEKNILYFNNNILFNAVLDPKSKLIKTVNFFKANDYISETQVMGNFVNPINSKLDIIYNEDFNQVRNYELFKLYLMKLGRIEEKYVSRILDSYFERMKYTLSDYRQNSDNLTDTVHPGGPCIPGYSRFLVDVNGNIYPCERVNENSDVTKIGTLDKGFDIDKIRALLNIGNVTEKECKNCWAFRFCTICAVFIDDGKELSRERKLEECINVKNTAELFLREYCMLQEQGFQFKNNHIK